MEPPTSSNSSSFTALRRSGTSLRSSRPGVARRGVDGAVEVQLFRRALAREPAQTPQRHLQIARAERHAVVEVAIVARSQTFTARRWREACLAHAHTFGVETLVAEGRGAGGADPFVAALVATLLFAQPLAQSLEQLVPAAQTFDAPPLFLAQQSLGELLAATRAATRRRASRTAFPRLRNVRRIPGRSDRSAARPSPSTCARR